MSPSDAVVAPSFKALEDLVVLISSLARAVVAAPKPLQVADLSMLLPLLPSIEALAGELGDLPGELHDLDEEEAVKLVGVVAAHLSVPDAHAEAVIEASFKAAVAVLELGKAIKG
jgi:hypothetical protein